MSEGRRIAMLRTPRRDAASSREPHRQAAWSRASVHLAISRNSAMNGPVVPPGAFQLHLIYRVEVPDILPDGM